MDTKPKNRYLRIIIISLNERVQNNDELSDRVFKKLHKFGILILRSKSSCALSTPRDCICY